MRISQARWSFLVLCAFLPSVAAAKPDLLCGPKCLLVVCQRFGITADLDEVVRVAGTDPQRGTSLAGLQRAAEGKGLQALAVKIGVDELARLELPAIAHCWDTHYVVVQRASGGSLEVTDPPEEPRLMRAEEFKKVFSGFALLISKDRSPFPAQQKQGPDPRCDSYLLDFGFADEGNTLDYAVTWYRTKAVRRSLSLTYIPLAPARLPSFQRPGFRPVVAPSLR